MIMFVLDRTNYIYDRDYTRYQTLFRFKEINIIFINLYILNITTWIIFIYDIKLLLLLQFLEKCLAYFELFLTLCIEEEEINA